MIRQTLMFCLLLPGLCVASIATDMDDFFNRSGFNSNTTAPIAYRSQAAGFYGGGSLYARNQVREYQLATLDLPDYRAGCAGIDLYTGSLSYLSGEKLIDLGKHIMSNGGAYAADVLLTSTVPQLKQTRDNLHAVLQKINQMSVNSCEMSQNLVGGMFPKTAATQEKVCNDQRRMGGSGLGHDYVSSRMACTVEKTHDESIAAAENDPKRKRQVVINKNIVWSMLQNKGFLSQDNELAEMAMSLTGTLIFRKDGQVKNLPALTNDSSLIEAMIGSPLQSNKKITLWHCNDTSRCLDPAPKEMILPKDSSLSNRVYKTIASIHEKIISDQALTESEKNFLEMTPLPVLKFLSVLGQTEYGDLSVDMAEYSTLIAQDLMQRYLSEVLQEMSNATFGSELADDLNNEVRQRIDKAQQMLSAIEPHVGRKLNEKLALINQVARIEKQTASSLANLY